MTVSLSVSERKRQDIARAALTLFARDGYERTSVDAIAAEAGVSKRTVYSHYGDKESLFLLVVRHTYEQMRERFAEIIGRAVRDVTDVEKSLVGGIREVVTEVTHTPERALLLRLMIAELPRFPALLDMWRNRAIMPILADVVTRLTAAGLLAARQCAGGRSPVGADVRPDQQPVDDGNDPAQRRRDRPDHHQRDPSIPMRLRPGGGPLPGEVTLDPSPDMGAASGQAHPATAVVSSRLSRGRIRPASRGGNRSETCPAHWPRQPHYAATAS